MTKEYLRRNLVLAGAIGAHAGACELLRLLELQKRPPKYVVQMVQRFIQRTAPIPPELAAWRDLAPDSPDFIKRSQHLDRMAGAAPIDDVPTEQQLLRIIKEAYDLAENNWMTRAQLPVDWGKRAYQALRRGPLPGHTYTPIEGTEMCNVCMFQKARHTAAHLEGSHG